MPPSQEDYFGWSFRRLEEFIGRERLPAMELDQFLGAAQIGFQPTKFVFDLGLGDG